ncbi:protein phosphatase regulator [Tilletia horrida]|uniref:Protein phosphatase regulator n=1 Tax=Tilletia horrida TaxID=155126 RepID=A0AAN6GBF5_9BASI|nr:protein phosphatase regulator [Tilletia horrida]
MSDELVAQFCDITGATPDIARSALDATKNDLTEAIANHFAAQEAAGGGDEADAQPASASSSSAAAAATEEPAKPQGPFSSTDPWDHTASASSSGPTRGGPTGFRNPAAGLANVFGGSGAGGGGGSGGSSSAASRNTSSSSRPGGIHTFRDLAAGRSGGGGGGGGGGGSGGGARIRTFRDLAAGNEAPSLGGGGGGFPGFGGMGGGHGHGHPHDDDDDDDDDDEPMDDPVNFYTGGERSGLSVQNPDHLRRRGRAPNDLVGNILKQAAEAGERAPAAADGGVLAAGGSGSAAGGSFGGSGRTLAGPSAEEEEGGASGAAAAGEASDAGEGEAEELPTAIRYLTFWANGYTLSDEGPLRSYDDPQDAAVLRAIEAQRAPLDVLGVQPGQPVELRVAKRLGEKWSPPPPGPTRAFEGTGQRLGAPVPGDVGLGPSGSSLASSSAAAAAAATAAAPSAPAVRTEFEIDRSQPTTQIQVRLAEGGERIVATLNHTHTIGDLRRYINASRPGLSERAYTLHASFPPKPLPSDESVSIKDAGLLSAVVIQRWS